jgi:anthranilate synthase component 1
MIYPTRDEFKAKTKLGNLIPLYTEIFADLETPVSAFLKLRRGGFNFLLESVEGGSQMGRYSFLGRDPSIVFDARENIVTIRKGSEVKSVVTREPLGELKKLIHELKPVSDPALPPFTGGAVGYIAYDVVRWFEDLPNSRPNDLGAPDMLLLFTDTIIAFDNVNHKLTVIYNVTAKEGDNLDLLYDKAAGVIGQILADLQKTLPKEILESPDIDIGERIVSNFPKAKFISAVEKCKKYITDGDIIQAVLSQRLQTSFKGDAFNLYRALRIINPSPYMFYLQFDDLMLVGASPEVHVRAIGKNVTIRPIAGTRPRGKSALEDLELEKELLTDEKERAEHLMLVDLARNDIGRVCKYGTVQVTEYMGIEHYSHVMHIVSNVVGTLEDEKDEFDLIPATFPAGTVSGAPKVRAMEIIDELEPTRRGPYAGLVGYFGFNDNFDSCIMIRTMLIKNGSVYVQVGAGIVADSVPQREYEETLNKAKALFSAMKMAKRR